MHSVKIDALALLILGATMHSVKIDALALLILGANITYYHCSLCCRPHPHVYRVHCLFYVLLCFIYD
jgi:hypothetical protein